MRVAIHQPTFFPWVPWWRKMAACDFFVILDHVPINLYRPGGWCRRCSLGDVDLVIPLDRKTRRLPISQIRIAGDDRWKRKHLRTIELRYSGFPNFQRYFPEIRDLYSRDCTFLLDFNLRIIHWLGRCFELDTLFMLSSAMNLKKRGQGMIAEILEKLEADEYIYGQGSSGYLDLNWLKAELPGLKLIPTDYSDKRPILDVLFGGDFDSIRVSRVSRGC
ncbi:MAG: WbqC family protein [Methanosarcinales archaeon]